MLGRIDVQTYDIGSFSFKVWIIGSHVSLDTMRLQSYPLPNSRNHHMTDTELFCQLPCAPMRRSRRWLASCPSQNLCFKFGGKRLYLPTLVPRIKTAETVFEKTLLPTGDVICIAAKGSTNRKVGLIIRQHYKQSCSWTSSARSERARSRDMSSSHSAEVRVICFVLSMQHNSITRYQYQCYSPLARFMFYDERTTLRKEFSRTSIKNVWRIINTHFESIRMEAGENSMEILR